ncbi:MAG TPA: hypothetical protein PK523_08885, partial [Elusimicrobiales bacterium]|nr:hypothetical protein [Elusimicrobiales bacterium]
RAAPPAAPGPGDKLKEFRLLFSYAAAELHAGEKNPSGGRKLLSERVIVNLERMRSLDGARLRRALLDGKDFGGELLSSRWRPTLRRDSAVWRPALLLNAAEMYARACDNAAAAELRALAAAAGLEPGEAGLKKAHCR